MFERNIQVLEHDYSPQAGENSFSPSGLSLTKSANVWCRSDTESSEIQPDYFYYKYILNVNVYAESFGFFDMRL